MLTSCGFSSSHRGSIPTCTRQGNGLRVRSKSIPCPSWRKSHLAANGDGVAQQSKLSEAESPEKIDSGKNEKSLKYTEEMQARMGTSHTYRHELGLDYNRILPDIIVGSCLQTADDVDHLADHENVKVIFCLQEDTDMAYWDLDIDPIRARCEQRGDIKHVRFPVRDFDPIDLRRKLPKAVAKLVEEHDPKQGAVYIHCTAGMGRAPAVAIAYMSWIRGMQIDEAYDLLTSIRRCGPKIVAIRSATADLLLGVAPVMTTIAVYRFGTAKSIKVAGLDVGWKKHLDMTWDPHAHRYELKRPMYPGTYQFKLIVDGHWTYSADHPSVQEGGNVNNVLEVSGDFSPEQFEKHKRIMSPGAVLTPEEQQELALMLCPEED